MKHTALEIKGFVDKARDHIEILEKTYSINSIGLASIIRDTGGILEDELNMLMIGSVIEPNNARPVIHALENFILSNDGYTIISLAHATKLISAYSELLASDEIINRPILTPAEVEWLEENNFLSAVVDDKVKDIKELSLKTVLSEHPDALHGFIKDKILVDSLAVIVNKYPTALINENIYRLILGDPINKQVYDGFNRAVMEAPDKDNIPVGGIILDNMEVALSKSTIHILELRNALIVKIKEVSGL